MNARTPSSLLLALPLLLAAAAPGCIITSTDDDDGNGDAGGTESGPAGTDGETDDGETNPPSDDSTGGDDMGEATEGDPSVDAPNGGLWLYEETGNTTNDCDFLDDPSNGWGTYGVEPISGGFTVTPGDDTDPFDCTSGGGVFECPERLQDELMQGDALVQVFVTIDGTLPSADVMQGFQNGEVTCEGADCALAEQVLGTSFPCSFSVEFKGERQG